MEDAYFCGAESTHAHHSHHRRVVVVLRIHRLPVLLAFVRRIRVEVRQVRCFRRCAAYKRGKAG